MTKDIYVTRNQMQILNMDEFNSYSHLERLHLTSNRIEIVTGRVNLTSLQVLSLAVNRIDRIDFCRWNAPSLSLLVISNNTLSEIPYCLTTMPNIKEIKFDMNRITHFEFYWIASLEYLYSIDLSSNYIKAISFNGRFPNRLNTISLQSNLLTSLDLSYVPVPQLSVNVEYNSITQFNISATSSNVTDLAMAGNPIDCSWTTREKNKTVQCTDNRNEQ
ncbi:leucine-rich repeat neuronal protein 3-like [Anopheles albimanus]|uniref:leucine-rich repeat neuronal protein 3-like n=1 Tax=Anopheles albimanus TaxID=7167 RepID=UPI0016407C54|nr:leucine-rich repeat neuronal protein 3-like [Anopheles albimanus]